MNRQKAWRKIRRKLSRARTCPFCGQVPLFEVHCDTEHSARGSWGHYAERKPCCRATFLGQTELFFTNDWRPPNYKLWWGMASLLIDTWNRRVA